MATSSFENAPVWFITGSSQGMGRAILDAVLASGQRVVATLQRPDVLAEYPEKYSPYQLLITRLDVSDPVRIIEVFKEVKEHFGRLGIVVNNTGYGIASEIETTPEDEARKLFEVNFWGLVNISKQALKSMRDINPPGLGGRILNMSSMIYQSPKILVAIEGFTESLNKEILPEWNIKALIIEPGTFKTEWYHSSLVSVPIPRQYDAEGAPSTIIRTLMTSDPIGDPAKAAQVLLHIVTEPDPPCRLQLGSDCVVIVREKAKKTLRENEKWAELGHSTNYDWFEKDKVLEYFEAINC